MKEAKPEASQIVPVSQTHRVSTSTTSVISEYEADEKRRQDELRGVEDEIFMEAMTILGGALQFADVEFDATRPTQEFIDKMVAKGRDPEKMFRIIKAGQMKGSEAPVGLMLAQKTAMGIIKARSTEKAEPKPLNVNVQVIQSMPEFKRIREE
jgi:hypothetical protein